MQGIPVSNVRNFALVGHSGSGKTAITDALAFKFGLSDRLGSTVSGTSISDHTEEEKARQISVFSAMFQYSYERKSDGQKFNICWTDTPGFMDFLGQMSASLRATDTALITVDAASGVQVGTIRGWKVADEKGVFARAFAVTGLDKDNTNYDATVSAIVSNFGDNCIPVFFPAKDGSRIYPIFDLSSAPAELKDEMEVARRKAVEAAAMSDDSLVEKYLAEDDLAPEEVARGLMAAAAAGKFVPIFPVYPLSGVGIDELVQIVCDYFANPTTRKRKDADGNEIDPDPSKPFVGLVWKTVSDPFVGLMNYVRVLSGTLKVDMEVDNPRTGKEKIGQLLIPCGKKQSPIGEATPGDIVAIPKLKATRIGDCLCAPGATFRSAPMVFMKPVMFAAVSAKTQADDDKLGPALQRILEQDPTLGLDRNAETKETILSGLGDVHLDVAVHMMKQLSNVNVTLSTPHIAYHETVTALGDGHHKHKKQSGGRGQYGEVYLRVERLPEGETEWFLDEIVGGAIPGNFLPAIQKGVQERMLHGSVAGYPVVGIKVHVYDGSYHDVDSSEVAFKIAGSAALRDALSKAKPVLLEPIMTVRVTTPSQFMGAINGDLSHKRGRVLGMETEDGMDVIVAEVPQAELFRYAAELRSMTGGQGTFSMEFARYDVVPSNVAQKVIAESPYKQHEEE